MKIVLLTLFLDLVGFSVLFPLYKEMLEHYGQIPGGLFSVLDELVVLKFGVTDPDRRVAFFGGLLTVSYAVVQFIVIPFWGRLSDRIGRRPVLVATTGLNALASILWVVSSSFEVFVVSRILSAFASGNISVASAAVADLSDEKNRAKGMGLVGAAIGLGFISGPLLGIAHAGLPHPLAEGSALLGLHPFSWIAAIAAGLGLFNFVQVRLQFTETLPLERRGQGEATRTANPLKIFSRDLGAGIARLNVAYLLFVIAFAGFESTLIFLFSDTLGWGIHENAGCMAFLGLTSVIIQGGVVRRVVDRTGERFLALLGFCLLIPGFAALAFLAATRSGPLAVTGLTLISAGVGFLSPTLAALVSLRGTVANQGRVNGAYRSAGALGRAIGPLVTSFAYFGFGPAAAPAVGAVVSVIPLLLLARMARGIGDRNVAAP